MEGLLYGVKSTDASAHLAASLIMLLAVLAALVIPALAALRVEPLSALRDE